MITHLQIYICIDKKPAIDNSHLHFSHFRIDSLLIRVFLSLKMDVVVYLDLSGYYQLGIQIGCAILIVGLYFAQVRQRLFASFQIAMQLGAIRAAFCHATKRSQLGSSHFSSVCPF